MIVNYREKEIKTSNNVENPNKHYCAFKVAQYLSVDEEVKYIHNFFDIESAVSKKWNTNYISSVIDKTVNESTKRFTEISTKIHNNIDNITIVGYVLRVIDEGIGHSMFVDENGKVIIDTSPTDDVDDRKITHCMIVFTDKKIKTINID